MNQAENEGGSPSRPNEHETFNSREPTHKHDTRGGVPIPAVPASRVRLRSTSSSRSVHAATRIFCVNTPRKPQRCRKTAVGRASKSVRFCVKRLRSRIGKDGGLEAHYVEFSQLRRKHSARTGQKILYSWNRHPPAPLRKAKPRKGLRQPLRGSFFARKGQHVINIQFLSRSTSGTYNLSMERFTCSAILMYRWVVL